MLIEREIRGKHEKIYFRNEKEEINKTLRGNSDSSCQENT